MEQLSLSPINFIVSIISFIISIILLYHFFRMVRNIEYIKMHLQYKSNKNNEAVLLFLNGDFDKSKKLIDDTFLIESIQLMDEFIKQGTYHEKGTNLINEYVKRYKDIYPEMNEDYFLILIRKSEKICIKNN